MITHNVRNDCFLFETFINAQNIGHTENIAINTLTVMLRALRLSYLKV